MGIHRITDTTGEPSKWKTRHFANMDPNEEFFAQLATEMPELLDITMIFGEEREKIREAILLVVFEGLMPAFETLKKIRAKLPMPELNERQFYENFAGEVWRAYKDMTQRAGKLLDPDIGFIFKGDKEFEKGMSAWKSKRPDVGAAVEAFLVWQRKNWQNDLSRFRNYLEHRGDTDPAIFAKYYEAAYAERLFQYVWRAIAEILAVLIVGHFSPGLSIVEIEPGKRNPARPRRFELRHAGLKPSAAGTVTPDGR